MPRNYHTERTAIIRRWYGDNPQPKNPRPQRTWKEGPINTCRLPRNSPSGEFAFQNPRPLHGLEIFPNPRRLWLPDD